MIKIIKIILLLNICLILFECSNNPSKTIIAEYNNGVVYLSEAINEYNNLSYEDKM